MEVLGKNGPQKQLSEIKKPNSGEWMLPAWAYLWVGQMVPWILDVQLGQIKFGSILSTSGRCAPNGEKVILASKFIVLGR